MEENNKQPTNVLFFTNQCQLACEYCVSGDTQIMMANNTTKSIKDIIIGDKIISIDENEPTRRSKNNVFMKFEVGTVTKLFNPRFVDKLYHIITENNNELYITGEHPLLVMRKKWKTVNEIIKSKEQILYDVDFPIYNNIDFINDEQYMIGYMTACWLGDGSFKKYIYKRNKKTGNKTKYTDTQHACRFVVKDDNIMSYFKKCLDYFGYDYNMNPFKISTKYNIIKDAFVCRKEETYNKILDLIETNLNKNTNENYYKGFLSGIYDCEGELNKRDIKISNSNLDILTQIETALKYFNYEYTIKQNKQFVNIPVSTVRLTNSYRKRFLETVYPQCEYKRIYWHQTSLKNKINIKSIEEIEFNDYVYNIETDTHTYIANNIMVHNCYEQQRMNLSEPFNAKFKDFKEQLDKLSINEKPNCMVTFGGEPTLCMDEIYKTVKYTTETYPDKFNYYVNTNGILLSDEKEFNRFKEFIKTHPDIIIVFSYDGSANFRRKFKDGTDSTEYVLKAINLFNDNNIPFNISYCLNYFNYDICIKDFIQILTKWKNLKRLILSPNSSELDKKLNIYNMSELNRKIYKDLNEKCLYLFTKFKKPICDQTCKLCQLCDKTDVRNYFLPNKEPVFKSDMNKFDIF